MQHEIIQNVAHLLHTVSASFCAYLLCTSQVEALEAKLKAEHPSWLAFCHNDLQCGNVMLDATSLARIGSGPGADNAMQDVSQFTVVHFSPPPLTGSLAQSAPTPPRLGSTVLQMAV